RVFHVTGVQTCALPIWLLLAKTIESVRFVGNAGFAILPDAVRGDRQNDVFEYGLSVARAVRPGVELVGEMNGRINTRSGEAIPEIGRTSGRERGYDGGE